MVKFNPVDYDPFEESQPQGGKFVPVDHDPFAEDKGGLLDGKLEMSDVGQIADLGASYIKGRSYGLAPKIGAAVGAGVFKAGSELAQAAGLTPEGYDTPAYADLYKKGVDMYTAPSNRADVDNPGLSLAAQLAGGLKTGSQILKTPAGAEVASNIRTGLLPQATSRAGKLANVISKGVAAAPSAALGSVTYGVGNSEVGREGETAGRDALLGGAIGGAAPIVLSGLGAGLNKLNTKTTVPNSDKISEAAGKLYEKLKTVSTTYKPEFTNQWIDTAKKSLLSDDELINQMKSSKPLQEAFDDLNLFKNQPMSMERAQALDEQLSNMIDGFVDAQGNINKAGKKILDVQRGFRHAIENASDDMIDGAKEGAATLKEARKLWATSRRLRDVERIIENADNFQVPATAIKTGFRRLLNSSKILGYSGEEVKAIKKAAQTGLHTDLMATFGSRILPLIGATHGAAGAALGAAASTASRTGATISQTARANDAAKKIAERSGMVKTTKRIQIPPEVMKKIMQMTPKAAKDAIEAFQNKK